MEFYVTLPSNAGQTPEESNQSNFTVRLPNTIDLSEGSWSVALSSIFFPVAFREERKDPLKFSMQYYDVKRVEEEFAIPDEAGFDSPEELENRINSVHTATPLKSTKFRPIKPEEDIEVSSLPEHDIKKRAHSKRQLEDWAAPLEPPKLSRAELDATNLTPEDARRVDAAFNEVIIRKWGLFSQAIISMSNVFQKYIDTNTNIQYRSHVIREGLLSKPTPDFTQEEMDVYRNKLDELLQRGFDLDERRDEFGKKAAEFKKQYPRIVKFFDSAYVDIISDEVPDIRHIRRIADEAKEVAAETVALSTQVNGLRIEQINNYHILSEMMHEIEELAKPWDATMKSHFDRVRQMVEKIVPKLVRDTKLQVFFCYDPIVGRFFLYNHKPEVVARVHMSKALAYRLGFELDENNIVKNIRMRRGGGYAKYAPDISGGISQIYVYMPDIIEPSYLGNTLVPLLRIINVDKPKNSIVEKVYYLEYHHRIMQKRISAINIQLYTSYGNRLQFNWGEVVVVLHFRRNTIF
jgi:chorismate mutase